jgi:hypothetical protein
MTLRRRGENGYLMILRMQIPPDKYSADLRIKHMSRVLIKASSVPGILWFVHANSFRRLVENTDRQTR